MPKRCVQPRLLFFRVAFHLFGVGSVSGLKHYMLANHSAVCENQDELLPLLCDVCFGEQEMPLLFPLEALAAIKSRADDILKVTHVLQ